MLKDKVYFKSVKACPNYVLEVEMGTHAQIVFDFKTRLDTARFGCLKDETLFMSVSTDGSYLIFEKSNQAPFKITAKEFMDLVLVDWSE